MTSITTDQLIQPTATTTTNRRSLRHVFGGFLAGAVLASGAFLGVSVVSDSGSSAKPAPAQQPSGPSAHDTAACPVVHGPC